MLKKASLLFLLPAILYPLAAFSGCSSSAVPREKYVMSLEYFPEKNQLAGGLSVTLPNRTDTALSELKFELWANAYREGAKHSPVSAMYRPAAYYAGESYGGIQITSLTGAASYAVTGEDENILSVTLPSALYPEEQVTLNMNFEVTLPQINHRLGVGQHTVNLTHFYPVLCYYGQNGFCEYVYGENGDPFVNECADFDVTLTVPESYTAVYAGEGECVAQNGKKAYHVITENVRDTAFVLGSFKSVSTTADGVPVEYFYFEDPSPETVLTAAAGSLSYFAKTFGSYRLPRYTLVQADFPYGGMEYAGLSLLSATVHASELPFVVAHETAHQWWYAAVGSNQFECAWQDEGLAEFSTALYLKAADLGVTYDEFVGASEKSYRAFFSASSQVNKTANTAMTRPLTSFTGAYEYRNIAYDKGVILLSRLRGVLGDGKFFHGLKRYYADYSGKIATEADFISCFSGGGAEGVVRSFTQGLCVI